MTPSSPRKLVKLSVLEYDERLIPIPLFLTSLGLMTGFTYMFPLLALGSLPAALFVIASILTGDITFVEEAQIDSKEIAQFEEE